jgi:hypothetical protein
VVSGDERGGTYKAEDDLRKIAVQWTTRGLPTDGTFPDDPAVSESDTSTENVGVSIHPALFLALSRLIGEHRAASKRPVEAAFRLFSAVAPENAQERSQLEPVLAEWQESRRWFAAHAHEPAPTSRHDVEQAELIRQFEQFERSLGALARAFYDTMAELDDILVEANR